MNYAIPPEIFEIGILNKEYHERLLLDLDRYAERANIPPSYIWSRLSQFCIDEDLQWVKDMKCGASAGLAYIGKKGKFNVPVESKMMAMTGAFLRNYIDARMMTVQEVIAALKEDLMPSPTVLLIPNFCMDKGDGGHIAQWEISSLLGLLYSRLARNLKTVVFVGSLAALEANYGEAFKAHISAHYRLI